MERKNSSFRQEDNQLIYTRVLNAPRDLVWEVWTDPTHLKEWWGPDGFSLTHKSMELNPGKSWNFIMHGSGIDYENHIEYLEVEKPSLLSYRHSNPDESISFTVVVTFEAAGDQTLLTMRSVFRSAEVIAELNRRVGALEKGQQTLDKLEAYLSAQIYIRQQLKTNNMSRVSTYLNFAGNTEEAFLFYRSVFGGEFHGKGIARFGDIPQQEGMPALSESDKKLILHVELETLGGHILMGTDAPESMGFKLQSGNNMHIHLEPDTRAQTKALFEALSAGGQVTMELQDMFWGAYYGSCTDKFGVQWMVNCTEQA
jgi:uncharacterized glyoxalase superfamily protein PhnB/uncharacterized protein YndB with AHSA1/START domain